MLLHASVPKVRPQMGAGAPSTCGPIMRMLCTMGGEMCEEPSSSRIAARCWKQPFERLRLGSMRTLQASLRYDEGAKTVAQRSASKDKINIINN